MQETQVLTLSQEDALEKEMATPASIIAWIITLTEGLMGSSPRGCKRVRYDLATKTTNTLITYGT